MLAARRRVLTNSAQEIAIEPSSASWWQYTRATLVVAVEGVVALATLVVTVFAVKGPLTWGGFYDALPNMRIGGYLIIVGLLLIIAHAVATARRPRA